MRQLVALAIRISPRIHETDHPLHAVRRKHDERQKRGQQHHQQTGKQLPVHAAQKQNAHRDHGNHRERTEVGFLEQQRAGNKHHREHRQKTFGQTVHQCGLAHRVIGGVEHREHLHQLRRLQIDDHQRQPAPRAVHFASDAGHQHQRQQHQTDNE